MPDSGSREIKIKFKPRQINLEPRDILKLSSLADGEVVEDSSGRHKPGAPLVINHGDIGSAKFPNIVFPAPNPIEFYLYSSLQNLERIRRLEIAAQSDYDQVNPLLLEEVQFCIFLVSALEAFLNQIIPDDFQIEEKDRIIGKAGIERWWQIEKKLKVAIPLVTKVDIASDSKIWATITS